MLENALRHARHAHDERGEAEIVFWLAVTLQWGPTPAPEAIRRGEEMLGRADGRPMMEGALLYELALAEAMCGRAARARELCSRGREIFDELGLRATAAGSTQVAGVVELLAGDPAAAEAQLRWGYEALIEMGETSLAPTSAALLAEALLRRRRYQEGHRFTELSEATAAEDDLASQILWRTARAKILVATGERTRAVRPAEDAVQIAERTDLFYGRGEAWTALAVVRAACRGVADAHEAGRRALAVYEAKQDVVSAGRTRTLLAQLGRSVPAGA
jgi:hypothetical protein